MASATDLLEQAKALGVMIRVVEGGVLEASQEVSRQKEISHAERRDPYKYGPPNETK